MTGVPVAEDAVQPAEVSGAPGETRHISRQLSRRGGPVGGPGMVAPQRLVPLTQRRRWVDAELFGQAVCQRPVGGARVVDTPGPVQCGHPRPDQPLPQRVLCGQRRQLGDDIHVLPGRQQQLGTIFGDRQPTLVQDGGGPPDQRSVQPGQRRPAPHSQRPPQRAGIRRRPAVFDQLVEDVQVELIRFDPQHVPRTHGVDDPAVPGQDRAQSGDSVAGLALDRGRCIVAPGGLDQSGQRDDLVGARQQRGEDRPLARPAQVDRPSADSHLERSEHTKLHRPSPEPVHDHSQRTGRPGVAACGRRCVLPARPADGTAGPSHNDTRCTVRFGQ